MKLRLRYSKLGKVRFLSHRDVARVWERAIRRARLPIAYSEGFSPRPKLHFGLALSVGHESVDEYLDIDLREPVPLAGLTEELSTCLPVGLDATAVAELPPGSVSLQEAVDLVVWRFAIPAGAADGVARRVAEVLEAAEWPLEVERKGKPQRIDLRPQVDALTVHPLDGSGPLPALVDDLAGSGGLAVVAELRTRPRSVRPGELLAALGLEGVDVRVRRLHQFIETDGVRRPPLVVEHTDPAPALHGAG